MVVRIYAGDTVTGKLWGELPVSAGDWKQEHRAEGNVGATLPLRGEVLQAFPGIVQRVQPLKCFLAAITDGGHVLEAGPIRPWKYSDGSAELKLTANGMRSYFAKRRIWDASKPGRVQDQVLTWANLSLGSIAAGMVQTVLAHEGSPECIELPDVSEPGTHYRQVFGFELAKLGERLRDIEDVEGGPDLALRPYLVGGDHGFVRWRMVWGSPELVQSGPDHVWDRSAPETPVDSLDVDIDPDEMGDIAWSTGSGSDTALLMAKAEGRTLRNEGYPLLETEEARSSVLEQSTLDSYARALGRRAQKPWQTWTLTVRPDVAPVLGTYRAGDWVRLYVGKDHPVIPARDGYYRTRIMAISGGLAGPVSLTLAPTLEDR